MIREHCMRAWFAVFMAAAIAGCEANHYEIDLKPEGENIQRQLTTWREQTADRKTHIVGFPDDELANIAAAYEAPVPIFKAKKHEFAGVFAGATPNDIGGSGSYTRWTSPLGSVSAYVERFRGSDDLLTEMEKRQQAADRLADLLIGWLAAELADEAGFAELREFLDDHFQRDLKNLSLYSWVYEIAGNREGAAQEECLVRAGQYLAERGYLKPDDLPIWTRAMMQSEREGPERLLGLIQRFIASKMGVAEIQAIPPHLAFLADASTAEDSINDYLRDTDEFKHLLAEWEQEKKTAPETERPEPNAVLGNLIMQALLPGFHIGQSDRLMVRLTASAQPFFTNGKWDEDAGQVQWSRRMLAADSELVEFPTLLYAFWSDPDEIAQEAAVGRVVLEADALGAYCVWRRGLSDQETKQWDAFVASLEPGNGLIERLRAFRFAGEPPPPDDDKADNDLASIPRELILDGLTGNATTEE